MKKTFKKLFAVALCAAVVVALAAVPAGAVNVHSHEEAALPVSAPSRPLLAAAGGSCDGNHSFVAVGNSNGTDCEWGQVNFVIYRCTKCGVEYTTGTRVVSSEGGGGEHSYAVRTFGGCPGNPITQTYCTNCSYEGYPTGGEHRWSSHITVEPTCTTQGTAVRECEGCGATEEVTIPTVAHEYGEVLTKAATCTENGGTYRECVKCQNQKILTVTPALGHRWEAADPADPSQGEVCGRCGETRAAQCEHTTWSGWRSDAGGHWVECVSCKQVMGEKSAHADADGDGKCDVCGYTVKSQKPACQHQWQVTKPFGALNHYEQCELCGETRQVSCATAEHRPRQYCTEPTYCVCGNKVADGRPRHNFGTWICHDETHEHKCLNIGCQYGEEGKHEYSVQDGVSICSVCNMKSLASTVPAVHTHVYGVWTSNGANGHSRLCTGVGCTETETAPHTLGAADCTGRATCTVCGAVVSTSKGSVHTGGTRVDNAKAAEIGKEGYTGDTICVGCGEVLEKGKTIEALKANHTHDHSIMCHDAAGHWCACECGDTTAPVGHTGGEATCATLAVCSICGESYGTLANANHVGGTELRDAKPAEVGVPGYTGDVHCLGCGSVLTKGTVIEALKESHTHDYSMLIYDSHGHWYECSCGDMKESEAHTYNSKGVCTVCGDVKAVEIAPEAAHVHAFSAQWKSDGTQHWHVCETCGAEADRDDHVFDNGKCADCGLASEKHAIIQMHEDDKAAAEAQLKTRNSVLTNFTDVKDSYYTVALQRMYNAGIVSGTSKTSYGVGAESKRFTLMTILARIAGVEGASKPETYKEAGEAWAKENGLYVGDREGRLTRQEMFFMLWKAAGGESADETVLNRFSDISDINAEYRQAVAWCVERGLVNGSSNAGYVTINAEGNASREQIAYLIAEYIDAAVIDISKL